MNRRTVLGSAGALVMGGLAGCVENVQQSVEGFFESPIPIEIQNDGDVYQNLLLEAYVVETGRQSYDQGFAVTPGENVTAQHLARTEQHLTVTVLDGSQGEDFGDENVSDEDVVAVEEAEITTETLQVTVRLSNDGVTVDVRQREGTAD